MIKESERVLGFYPWGKVGPRFRWGQPGVTFMTVEQVCLACGFDPSPGELASIGRHMKSKGVRLMKYRGQRGALMPPMIDLLP
jgi:hypothetical protein